MNDSEVFETVILVVFFINQINNQTKK